MFDGQRRPYLIHHSLRERSWQASISSRPSCWPLKSPPASAIAFFHWSETVWCHCHRQRRETRKAQSHFFSQITHCIRAQGLICLCQSLRDATEHFFSSRNRRQLCCLPSCGAESITAGHAGKWQNKETMKWNEQKVGLMALRSFRMEEGFVKEVLLGGTKDKIRFFFSMAEVAT